MADITLTNDAADLRKVFLHTFEAFATDPATVAEEVDGINAKYARQLLTELVKHGIVAKTDVNDEGTDVWQTIEVTTDDSTMADAEIYIDGWLAGASGKPAKTPREPKAVVAPHDCFCGCGEKVPGKSFYRPGHDARHAGQIGRLVASTGDAKHYDALASDKLRVKAQGIAAKAIEKVDAKRKSESEKAEAKRETAAAKATAKSNATVPEVEHGQVKVGKGRFDAVRHPDGSVEYQSSDGSLKPASVSATKSFKPVA